MRSFINLQVLRDEIQLADRKAKQQRTFYIDPSLTTNVVATFHITRGNTHSVTEETFPDVALESPTGEVIWMDSEKCDVDKTLGVLHYRFQKAVVNVCLFVLEFYGPFNNEVMSSRSFNSGTIPGQA